MLCSPECAGGQRYLRGWDSLVVKACLVSDGHAPSGTGLDANEDQPLCRGPGVKGMLCVFATRSSPIFLSHIVILLFGRRPLETLLVTLASCPLMSDLNLCCMGQ